MFSWFYKQKENAKQIQNFFFKRVIYVTFSINTFIYVALNFTRFLIWYTFWVTTCLFQGKKQIKLDHLKILALPIYCCYEELLAKQQHNPEKEINRCNKNKSTASIIYKTHNLLYFTKFKRYIIQREFFSFNTNFLAMINISRKLF